jgi:hypothetical protein
LWSILAIAYGERKEEQFDLSWETKDIEKGDWSNY